MKNMRQNRFLVLSAAILLTASGMQLKAAERRLSAEMSDDVASELIEDNVSPRHVRTALYEFLNHPLVHASINVDCNKDPETGALNSRSTECNFTCPTGMGLIPKIKDAFEKDEDVSYSLTHFLPYQSCNGNSSTLILTSDKPNVGITFRANRAEEGLVMCVSNARNKDFRDAYCISWRENDGKLKGSILMVTSRRPDVVERLYKAKSMVQSLSPDELEAYRQELTKDMSFNELSSAMEKYGITLPKKKLYSDTKMNDLATYRDQLQKAANACLQTAAAYSKRGTKADRLLAKECMKQYKDYQKKLAETDKAIQKLLKKNR